MTVANQDWGLRSVLVTGCTGFVGSWMVRTLCGSGAQVVGLCRAQGKAAELFPAELRRGLVLVQGELSDRELLRRTVAESKVDTVFHLAAQSKVERARQFPAETFETNVQGTWNVLESVRRSGRDVGVLLASSDTVYRASDGPSAEDSLVSPSSPYASSKLCAEAVTRCYHESCGIPTCIARTTNLYGGGDFAFERLIPGTIRAVIRGEAPVVNSNGRPERDYLYIEDALAGYLSLAAAMREPGINGGTFNFSTAAPASVSSVVDMILRLMGRGDLKPRILGQCDGEVSRRYSSASKVERAFGWTAKTPFESGLMKTIDWYKANTDKLGMEIQDQ